MKVTLARFLLLSVVVAGLLAGEAAGATCDPTELSPCAEAILYNSAPSSQCCSKLKAQSPCFCQYMKDPTLASYLGAGRKLAATCGVALPKC